jgi:tocopherol O-methyltransferase
MNNEEIIAYYDSCEFDYRLLWDLDYSHAMHVGYWDEHTRTLRDALRRENEILAERASIQESDRILDAGCGVGGSSFYLAQKYGCEVVGITLSAKQAATARLQAEKARIYPQPTFEVMDYTATHFPDQSFDVVWAIESLCHAKDKHQFVKEAMRLLKKNGRLIIADGFAMQSAYVGDEASEMQRWLKAWGVDSLETIDSFYSFLLEEGFTNISYENITTHVMPSSKRLYWYSWPAIGLSKCLELLGLRSSRQTENIYGARFQYITLKKSLWQYGIFKAEKST